MLFGIGQSLGYFPTIGLEDWTLDHYLSVLTDRTFLRSLWLTFRIAFISTVGSAVLAVGIALVLRYSFPGSRLTTFVFQIPLPVPHLVAASGLVLLVTQSGILSRVGAEFGLINRPADFPVLVFDRPGITIILTFLWKEAPFIGLVVLAVLKSVGPQYEEIARTLGANAWQRFFFVLLPLIMPGVLSLPRSSSSPLPSPTTRSRFFSGCAARPRFRCSPFVNTRIRISLFVPRRWRSVSSWR